MTPEQRRLYVRHILLPEIGKEGQARLCDAHFEATEDYAGAIRARYLHRAGLQGNDVLEDQRGDPSEAVRGAFEAVEALKEVLGVGAPGTFPNALFSPEDAS